MARAKAAASARSGAKAIAQRPALQWAAAGVGLLMTLITAGILLSEALQPSRPAALTVQVEGMRQTGTLRILDIVVVNTGSETASAVEVTGKAGDDSASVTLDYVPGDGRASASLAFPANASKEAVLTITGWSAP